MSTLKEMAEVLEKKLLEICTRNPRVFGNVYVGCATMEITVNLSLLRDQNSSEKRNCVATGLRQYLLELTGNEMDFLCLIAKELAGAEFTVMLHKFDVGTFAFFLIPEISPTGL